MDDLRAVDREFCLLPHGGLGAGTAFLEMAGEFANSIDELAWFVLLILFELETYALSGKAWKGWMSQAVRAARLVCYALIAHSIYIYTVEVVDLHPTV